MYTELQLQLLNRLLVYSKKYQISIQFRYQIVSINIAKDNYIIMSYVGNFNYVIQESIDYLNEITKTKPSNPL